VAQGEREHKRSRQPEKNLRAGNDSAHAYNSSPVSGVAFSIGASVRKASSDFLSSLITVVCPQIITFPTKK
jgi:hypothetical protein